MLANGCSPALRRLKAHRGYRNRTREGYLQRRGGFISCCSIVTIPIDVEHVAAAANRHASDKMCCVARRPIMRHRLGPDLLNAAPRLGPRLARLATRDRVLETPSIRAAVAAGLGEMTVARVLAVDDEPHMTRVVATWLTKNGHEVVCASDGGAALELLRAEPFDVLITDVDMPHMDGLSLLSQRDVVERLRGIVLITGRCDYKNLVSSCPKEMVRLLPKPFSPSRLAEFVEELLALKSSPGAPQQLAPTR